jgi:hypothetical protein
LSSKLYSPVQIPTTPLCKLPSERQQNPPSQENSLPLTTAYWVTSVGTLHQEQAIWQQATGSRMKTWPLNVRLLSRTSSSAGSQQPLQGAERVYLHGKCVETRAACIPPHYIPCPAEARLHTHIIKRNPNSECINLCCTFIDR